MTRTRIKFCGITRREDAVDAVALGVDAIGMVFARRSPRFVDPERAASIRAAVPPLVSVVALFLDDDPEWVRLVEHAVRPDLLQFHGGEPAGYCEGFDTAYLKAVAMAGDGDLRVQLDAHPRASGFLLDGHAPGEAGGTGRRFDWSRAPAGSDRPLLLAGGLEAGNVGEAIARVRPWGVDVSSGIERSPGVKDAGRMSDFVRAVHAADRLREDGP